MTDEELLRWASRLHEIGLTIAHSQYHKHGAYLLRYSDLPGFTQQFQQELATLVRGHRRKFSPSIFDGLDPGDVQRLKRLCVLLRLGVLLQHARNYEAPPQLSARASDRLLQLTFDENWLSERPLTLADLENEKEYLARQDFVLEVQTR